MRGEKREGEREKDLGCCQTRAASFEGSVGGEVITIVHGSLQLVTL